MISIITFNTHVSFLSKGDIVDVDLGQKPNAIKGHEQAKERPCVIIKAFNNLGLAIILPITGTKPPQHLFTFVHLAKGMGGLSKESFVLSSNKNYFY